MALVSVIIPCFNAGPWIREALQSVVQQGLDDLEIIVVDDGSTDGSAYIVEKEFSFVNLVKTENRGPSRTRNLGTQLSSGQFIQYLDADDLLAPGKLGLQLETLVESGADIAYGDWQKLIRSNEGNYVKGEVTKRKLQNPENPEIDLFTADFWCPPAVYLFRRSMVEKTEGWNEELPIAEDVRFILDCVFRGARLAYCEGTMAYYRVPSGKSASTRDPIAFIRCCLQNALEVEEWWESHGGTNPERVKALIKVYGYVARASFEKDRQTFEVAYQALERLRPGYAPEKPRHLRLASKLLGYRRAETAALWYRRIKSLLTHFM